jgi:hypothetical protein
MYDGTVERDRNELDPLFDGLERSVLQRVTTVRALVGWLRGRLALHLGDRKGAQHAIARLGSVDNPRSRVVGAMLEAGVAGRAQPQLAVQRLRDATKLAHDHELRLHSAAARYQLGVLLGGSEGTGHIAEAERTMRAEGIAKPDRFAHWYVPGLERQKPQK